MLHHILLLSLGLNLRSWIVQGDEIQVCAVTVSAGGEASLGDEFVHEVEDDPNHSVVLIIVTNFVVSEANDSRLH